MSDQTIRGRCLCGAVRYELDPPTAFASHCHCESCRRAHAAAFVTWTRVADEALRLSGRLTDYVSSPGVTRSFCPVCGTQMTFRGDDTPGQVYLPLATLVDPPDREPDGHVSWEEHVPWIEATLGGAGLPSYRAKTEQRID